jgi:hypothetical protein
MVKRILRRYTGVAAVKESRSKTKQTIPTANTTKNSIADNKNKTM